MAAQCGRRAPEEQQDPSPPMGVTVSVRAFCSGVLHSASRRRWMGLEMVAGRHRETVTCYYYGRRSTGRHRSGSGCPLSALRYYYRAHRGWSMLRGL